jgi:uncharacterized membrane protein
VKHLYHIIFERFYQAFHRGWGGFDKEDTLFGGTLIASTFISLLEGFIIISISGLYSYTFYGKFDNDLFIYTIASIIAVLNWRYFFYKKKYLIILKEIKINRTPNQRRIHTILAIGFALLTFIIFIGGLCLKDC